MLDLDFLASPATWVSLSTLTAMEIVLGIDNIVFLSIVVARLEPRSQERARRLGLALALILRIGLLLAISWVMSLTTPFLTLGPVSISGRDVILLGGGLFLIAKSTHEMFEKLEVERTEDTGAARFSSFFAVIAQILVLDIVFSLDSVITAVGMARDVRIMVMAMVVAVLIMLAFAKGIGDFVNHHPSMKILALSFLLLVGVMLMAEGMHQHIDKGYIYFAMAFSLGVELINLKLRKRQQAPVKLHERFEEEG